MAVCIACGTDNRDKALFCRGCATSMVALVGSTAAAPTAPAPDTAPSGPTQTCPACQAKNSLVATSCKNCRISLVPDMVAPPKTIPAAVAPSSSNAKLVVMVSLALVTTAVGTWWWSAQGGSSAPVAAQAVPVITQTTGLGIEATESSAPVPEKPVVSTDAASVVAAEAQATRIKEQAAAVASADRARRIRERKEKEARELAAAEKLRAAQAAEQRQAEQARRRAEETARQKAAEAAALAAAKPPPPVQTVDTICASSTNFVAREVCRTRECKNPAFTKDPVCVRFREVEAANTRQPMF
ncbi:zinc ribbon domain-containing protein [Hydrogenophaga palleronii]|nr:zinc ribbon domain-containing protein [Hydrogenophaga palleronii]